jgi:hypothetical protein
VYNRKYSPYIGGTIPRCHSGKSESHLQRLVFVPYLGTIVVGFIAFAPRAGWSLKTFGLHSNPRCARRTFGLLSGLESGRISAADCDGTMQCRRYLQDEPTRNDYGAVQANVLSNTLPPCKPRPLFAVPARRGGNNSRTSKEATETVTNSPA